MAVTQGRWHDAAKLAARTEHYVGELEGAEDIELFAETGEVTSLQALLRAFEGKLYAALGVHVGVDVS